MKVDRYLACLGTQFRLELSCESVSADVRGRALKTDLREETGTALLRGRLVLLDHVVNPREFSRHVHVVSAILSTSLDDRLAVLRVGADGGQKDVCLLGDCLELIWAVDTSYLNLWTVKYQYLAQSDQSWEAGVGSRIKDICDWGRCSKKIAVGYIAYSARPDRGSTSDIPQ